MSNTITTYHNGIIKLNETVLVGDPCYSVNGCELIKKVKPGIYFTAIRDYDGCISRLIAIHENFWDNATVDAENFDVLGNNLMAKGLTVSNGYTGVDSGQSGIYDYDYFRQNEKGRDYNDPLSWYRRICDTTLSASSHGSGTLDNRCVVSRSGFGDGCYEYSVYRLKNTREAVAFVIDFAVEEPYDYEKEEYNED